MTKTTELIYYTCPSKKKQALSNFERIYDEDCEEEAYNYITEKYSGQPPKDLVADIMDFVIKYESDYIKSEVISDLDLSAWATIHRDNSNESTIYWREDYDNVQKGLI